MPTKKTPKRKPDVLDETRWIRRPAKPLPVGHTTFFGARLRNLRTQRGWSTREAAKRISQELPRNYRKLYAGQLTHTHLQLLERGGAARPLSNLFTILALSSAYDVDPLSLCTAALEGPRRILEQLRAKETQS